MNILYGVVGEGMGHATRSRVVLGHLLDAGHRVRVVVSGKAHGFLKAELAPYGDRVEVEEIHGLTFQIEGNRIDKSETFSANLEALPRGLKKNVDAYFKLIDSGFTPELVFSDFETWAYLYGLNHRLPVISLDNMQVLNRCAHDGDVTTLRSGAFLLAKNMVKMKMPGAWHYLVTSFFFPPVRKKRTTLVPPILRPDILAAERDPRDHVLVYLKAEAAEAALPALASLPGRFKVYGTGREGAEGNIELRPFSGEGFVDDLRTAKAVVAAAGFSLMGEAVHLQVPMMALPIQGQYEQTLNALYLEKLGYGVCQEEALTAEGVAGFLDRVEHYQQALAGYTPQSNEVLFGCVDELVRLASLDEPPPESLDVPNMGTWVGPPLKGAMAEALD